MKENFLQQTGKTCTVRLAKVTVLRTVQLAVGFDADIVIFDPAYEGTISYKTNLEGVDYSPFEGFAQKGRPETVFLRGQKIVEDAKYIGHKGQGKFVPGKPFGASDEW